MRLYTNPMSPFGRKVAIVIRELGIEVQVHEVLALPRQRPEDITGINPIGKIPVLEIAGGQALRDSPVIMEYLATEYGGAALLPASGPDRWQVLCDLADGDAIIETAILVKNERARPAGQQAPEFLDWHGAKVIRALEALNARAGDLAARFDLGVIAIGCALSYVQMRMPEHAGLTDWPGLAALHTTLMQRPSFAGTLPAS
jgi:glutathione S-transferase